MRAALSALVLGLACALLGLAPGTATAQVDPPGRVGRLADIQGNVSWFDQEHGSWAEAERNRPLTSGDRLSTAPGASAELRVGSTVLRLDAGTELEVLRLDDEQLVFQLHSGSLALRVRSREVAAEVQIVTAEVRLQPLRAGHYRIDRVDDSTQAGSWRGDLQVEGEGGLVIATGQRAELWRDRGSTALRSSWNALPSDEFAAVALAQEQRDERTAATRFVSPEMTGAEELDRNGRWDTHPEYGAVWFPQTVREDWAPYRYGSWAWVQPWGWTWVDEARWGFAPFHYGRWVHWRDRWGWVPGVYVPRPVFAPALVAWVGGARGGVSLRIGGPTVGWVPLAPREAFVPWYRHTPVYVGRVNTPHWTDRDRKRDGNRDRNGDDGRGRGDKDDRRGDSPSDRNDSRRDRMPKPTGPRVYGNQGMPGGMTEVPRDAMLRRQPVERAVIGGPDARRPPVREALLQTEPPQGPAFRGRPGVGTVNPGNPATPRPAFNTPAPASVVGPTRQVPAPAPAISQPAPAAAVDPRRDRGARADRGDRPDRGERVERPERVDRGSRSFGVPTAPPAAAPVAPPAPAPAPAPVLTPAPTPAPPRAPAPAAPRPGAPAPVAVPTPPPARPPAVREEREPREGREAGREARDARDERRRNPEPRSEQRGRRGDREDQR